MRRLPRLIAIASLFAVVALLAVHSSVIHPVASSRFIEHTMGPTLPFE